MFPSLVTSFYSIIRISTHSIFPMSSRNKCIISSLLTLQLMLSAIYAAELATNLNRDGSYIRSENIRRMITAAFITSAIWFFLTVLSLCGLMSNCVYLLIPHLVYTGFLIIFTFGSLVILILSDASMWPHILASITGGLLLISLFEHIRIVISMKNLKSIKKNEECAMRPIVHKKNKCDK